MKLEWIQAPVKTQWGDEMVVASVAIDKDHTVCLYCERDQTAKVEAMFTQRTWVWLTDEQRMEMWRTTKFRGNGGQVDWFIEGTRAAEAAHGIKV